MSYTGVLVTGMVGRVRPFCMPLKQHSATNTLRMTCDYWIERRLELCQYSRLMEELRLEGVAAFKNFTRVEPGMFAEIVERVSHIIWKQGTSYRKALEPVMKVALTQRHLATGDSYHSLVYGFKSTNQHHL